MQSLFCGTKCLVKHGGGSLYGTSGGWAKRPCLQSQCVPNPLLLCPAKKFVPASYPLQVPTLAQTPLSRAPHDPQLLISSDGASLERSSLIPLARGTPSPSPATSAVYELALQCLSLLRLSLPGGQELCLPRRN